jgi:DNA-binding CsgD family transcriptional regulator
VHLRLAGAAVTAARWDVATHHLATAGALVDAAGFSDLRAELALRQAELAIDTNDMAGAGTQAHRALDLARAAGLGDVECAALQVLGRCARRSSLQDADIWFRQALDAAARHGLAMWRLRSMHEVATIALLDRFEVDGLLEAQALAETLGAMATATVLDIEIAAGYNGQHDLDAEARHGLRAVRRGGELGLDVIVAYGWQHVAGAAVLSGDRERAASAAVAGRAAAPGNRDIDGLLVGAEMVGSLVDDDVDGALELAERCTTLLRGSQTAPPAHFRAAWPLLLALAHRREAMAAVEEMEQAGVGVNRGGRGWLLLARAVLAGQDDPTRAAALAVEADATLVRIPLWRYLGRRLTAQAASVDGWFVPDGWMGEAEGWLRDHGYRAVAATCRSLRKEALAGVPASWAGLGITPREADVLALVIDGLSNREIAERLYLSVRTVEKHVEALLRKTATRSRTQLARLASTT